MAVGKELKQKTGSIKNTQKITNAMEKVAASKMRRAQDRMAKPSVRGKDPCGSGSYGQRYL